MDDLVASGIAVLLSLLAVAAILIAGIVYVILLELHAFANGDYLFVLGSIGVLFLLCVGYAGTGLWLRRTGRI